MSEADTLIDGALGALATQLKNGWARWPGEHVGARVLFVITVDGVEHARTLRFDAERPRLFSGVDAPAGDAPFLLLRMGLPQLFQLLTNAAAGADVVAEGNAPTLLAALSACLADGARAKR